MEVEQSAWEGQPAALTLRPQPMAGRRRKAKRREPGATIITARRGKDDTERNRKRRLEPPDLQMARPECRLRRNKRNIRFAAPMFAQLNLREKFAVVRRRLAYVQKRGYNERKNYNYVTAADIAGSVGDILAELGVIVVPQLESISTETPRSSPNVSHGSS